MKKSKREQIDLHNKQYEMNKQIKLAQEIMELQGLEVREKDPKTSGRTRASRSKFRTALLIASAFSTGLHR